MNDENFEKLLTDFEQARVELHSKGAETSQKPSFRYETLYGEAYQRLVNVGLKSKLRMKYRPLY